MTPQSKSAGSIFKIVKDMSKLPLRVADPRYIPNGYVPSSPLVPHLFPDPEDFILSTLKKT